MSRVEKTCFRIVGGNRNLVAIKRSAHDRMWPRLRVVGQDDVLHAVAAPKAPQSPRANRPAWALMWMVGLAVATAQGISQAIASYW